MKLLLYRPGKRCQAEAAEASGMRTLTGSPREGYGLSNS